MKKTETRQRIILAAIDIINTDGTEAITTRRIAETANVNTAAMNYYFGSKENLIEQVLHITLSHIFDDWDMILDYDNLSTPEKIFFLIDYMIAGISMYPGLTGSYLFDSSVNTEIKKIFIERLDKLLDAFTSKLTGSSSLSPEKTKLYLGQIVLSAISASMIPESFEMLTGGDINSRTARRKYILPLVKAIPGIELELTLSFLERTEELRKKAFKA
ncbi:MAG: TetR/AcrR family transcriptional regulator [Candidatus Sabulitectum sp.]|nr:TetR/AcrR family transcriptional regulator [Candidatus Sabulitectum sp.]